MAASCTTCTCTPYTNVCCCPQQSGISVMQPTCQLIPGEVSPVINPCFCSTCSDNGTSYWTYKFFTDCVPGTEVSGISHILIPICIDILPGQVTVEEKVDGCGTFNTLVYGEENDYFLTTQDGNPPQNFGPAPEGFQWLKILPNGRYDKGVCVLYRVGITGNYPPVTEAIRVKAGTNKITACLNPGPCFLVPGCPVPGQLAVTKTCTTRYANNMATIHYEVVVSNIGDLALNNVSFTDTITYNSAELTLGTPTNLSPVPPLTAATGVGTITVTAVPDIGPLAPGATFTASYDVPITNITAPGTLSVSNTATASATGTTGSNSCTANIAAVQISATKCCVPVDGTSGGFRILVSTVGNSPDTTVTITDQIKVPSGVTVQFPGFGGCTAIFENDGPILPNTDVTNATIILTCSNVPVPGSGGTATISIPFTLVSTTAFTGSVRIENTVQQVVGLNNDQVYLPPQIISPAAVVVQANAACDNNVCPETLGPGTSACCQDWRKLQR